MKEEAADLQAVLQAVAEEMGERKLARLKARLETALGCPLFTQTVDDPMVIRRQLVEHLRKGGSGFGAIQAAEQLFMGVVRRAAVKGLIPAPPEGPWTRSWQSVLDSAAGATGKKAPLRLLAGWATSRHLEPEDVDEDQLAVWIKAVMANEAILPKIRDALSKWESAPYDARLESSAALSERLLRKASRGTVFIDPRHERTR